MISRSVGSWCTLVLFSLTALAQTEEEGFVPLFNGRDLTGWVNVNCAPETWTVEPNGLIACTGKPTGALRTEQQYENFILEVEWRHLEKAGNAGIFVWASPLGAVGQPFLRAIEVQVLDEGYGNTESHTTHGDIFPIHGSTMKPLGHSRGSRAFPSEWRSKPSPEWNHYRVEARDGTIRLQVNGKEVTAGEECSWRKGYLGLESEGAPTEWRGARIKVLPPSGASPAQTAPIVPVPFRPLYTGTDLRGWHGQTLAEQWSAKDWQLVGHGDEPIWTDAEFGQGVVIVDYCQAGKEGISTPAVLVGGPGATALRVPLATGQPGTWKRTSLHIEEGQIIILSDGEPERRVMIPPGTPARGSLGLVAGCPDGVTGEFANLYTLEAAAPLAPPAATPKE